MKVVPLRLLSGDGLGRELATLPTVKLSLLVDGDGARESLGRYLDSL